MPGPTLVAFNENSIEQAPVDASGPAAVQTLQRQRRPRAVQGVRFAGAQRTFGRAHPAVLDQDPLVAGAVLDHRVLRQIEQLRERQPAGWVLC
jgi:hypothetical protein